jgi:hypothetical protein
VGPVEANKQHESVIGLSRDRLTVALEAGSAPAVPGEGTAAARPSRPPIRRARRQCAEAGTSGGCAGVQGGVRGGWPATVTG